MKVSQIYSDYMVPKNLQEHMLKVASVAGILLENWKGEPVDKTAIIRTCIFHDIAKPVSFDLTKQKEFGMSEPDIEKLRQLQERIKKSFGSDEHNATVAICKEIGLSQFSVKLVDNLEWKYIQRLIEEQDIQPLIPIYADMRISPKGILSLEDRVEELKNRISQEEAEQNLKDGKLLETLIKERVNVDVNSITDADLEKNIPGLLDTEI